jgi:hypothetical protein
LFINAFTKFIFSEKLKTKKNKMDSTDSSYDNIPKSTNSRKAKTSITKTKACLGIMPTSAIMRDLPKNASLEKKMAHWLV